MFLVNKSRLRSSLIREINTSQSYYASHYDVLGITPKATQNDIKTAYYNLSKIHHPDKSKDEESAKKFRAITEAYEVLGNVNLKKMYDKGLLVGRENSSRMHYNPEPEPTDPTLKFYKSRTKRQVSHFTASGKAHVYDFDAWSANHYGEVFKKAQKERERSRNIVMKSRSQTVTFDEHLAYVICFVLISIAYLTFHDASVYDRDMSKNNKEEPPEKTR